jgi:hypothetical protein
MNRSIQSEVDRLLLDQGEYQPLEYLLQEGRLSYTDYEAWRSGQLEYLDEALFGDPEHISQQLAEAEDYLQRRGWEVEPGRYKAWHGARSPSRSQVLRFSADRMLNDCFHRHYRKPQDQPQLDLFTDSPATSLANGIAGALADRNPKEARRLLARLCDVAPDHVRLGEFERLTEAAERLDAPVDDISTEFQYLQATLTPLADSLLGQASRNLLIPLWQRLSVVLQDRPYRADESELHLSYTAAEAQDWIDARRAVEREPDWQSDPVLLLRHARACERTHDNAAALPSWLTLCWSFPQHAEAVESTINHELRHQWETFADPDPARTHRRIRICTGGLSAKLPDPVPTAPQSCAARDRLGVRYGPARPAQGAGSAPLSAFSQCAGHIGGADLTTSGFAILTVTRLD